MSIGRACATLVAAAAAMCCAHTASAQVAAATNDLCNSATSLTLNQLAFGTTTTGTSYFDGPSAPCQASSGRNGLWFTYTPAVTNRYQISASGSRLDSILTVFSAVDCSTYNPSLFVLAPGGCNDDSGGSAFGPGAAGATTSSCISNITLNAGQQYWIRLSGFSTTAFAQYQIGVFAYDTYGACCSVAGVCTLAMPLNCGVIDGTSVFLGSGSTCTVNPCVGVCCNNTSFACSITLPGTGTGGCLTGSTWQGFGTTCPVSATCVTGACCTSGAVCTTTTLGQCTTTSAWTAGVACGTGNAGCYSLGACCNTTTFACTTLSSGTACASGSTFQGFGTTCVTSTCVTGACCTTSGVCTANTLLSACTNTTSGSKWIPAGTCTTNPCSQACCNTTTFACTVVTGAACGTGTTTKGLLSACTAGSCASGACCTLTGTCTLTAYELCSGANQFAGVGTVCTTNSCTAACCDNAAGTCSVVILPAPTSCTSQGLFSTCAANPCPPLGACCTTAGVCSLVLPVSCLSPNLSNGAGSTCTASACIGACCKADGTCVDGSSGSCANIGIYSGNGNVCSAVTCASSIGRCCTGATCAVVASTSCASGFTAGGTCTTNLCTFPCCDILTGACTVIATGTSCSGVSGAGGAACTTIVCPAPANDLCVNASVINGSGPFPLSTFGQNATATDTAAFTPAVCISSSRDVWYSFTPSAAAAYSFTLCNTYTGTFDTVLSIHSACPTASANNLQTGITTNCNDDGCSGSAGPSAIGGLTLTPGQTYLIRVSRWSTGTGAPFRLDITTEPFGACCDSAAVCALKTQSACIATSGSVFTGGGTSCSTTGICNGACCTTTTGVCALTVSTSCTGAGQVHRGVGTTCTVTTCATTTCCNPSTGVCTTTGTDACPSGTNANAATTCTATTCPSDGACCSDNGSCTFGPLGNCASGSLFQGVGVACGAGNTCPVTTVACCNDTTAVCTFTVGTTCPSGSHTGSSVCTPNTCLATAYCTDSATSTSFEKISNVTIDTFNQSDTTSTGGYLDFTAVSPPSLVVTLGTNITVTLRNCFSTDLCTVYVDWDHNFTFSGVSESFVLTGPGAACGGSGTPGTFTGTITPPVSTLPGNTRMRVVMGDGTSPSCGTYTYGQVWDLTVNVQPLVNGACCNTDGSCTVSLPTGCVSPSLYQGGSTTCSGAGGSCPNTVSACCNTTTAVCTFVQGATCPSGNIAQGSVCSPNSCPTTGACCKADGSCSVGLPAACASPNLFQSLGTTCSGAGASCPITVSACCNGLSAACSFVNGSCPSGSTANGSVCSPSPCVGLPAIVQNFDANVALPACWTPSNTGSGTNWAVVTDQSNSSFNSIFAVDQASASSETITLPPFTALGPVTLDLWARWQCENATTGAYDGWLVEVSINGGAFANLTPAAWSQNGYSLTEVLTAATANPYTGQSAFLHNSGGGASPIWVNPRAGITAVAGDQVQIRFVMTSDGSIGTPTYAGVWLDDITIANAAANGTCCDASGGCTYVSAANCTGGSVWSSSNCTCTTNPCTQPQVGTCCQADGTCTIATPGNPLGSNTASCSTGTLTVNGTCTPNTCPQPSGVCCRGSTCTTAYTTAGACAAAMDTVAPATVLSKFVPTATVCNTPVTTPGNLGNLISPCCYANYNHNATLEIQDIFDFLNDWFAGKKASLVGGDGTAGTLQIQNIFDFLNAWFAGGCN